MRQAWKTIIALGGIGIFITALMTASLVLAETRESYSTLYCNFATVEIWLYDTDDNGEYDQFRYYVVNYKEPFAILYLDEETGLTTHGEVNGTKYKTFDELRAEHPQVCPAARDSLEMMG